MRESFILARPGDTIFSDPRYAVSDSRYAVSDSRYAVMLITADWHPKAHRDLISEIKKISCACVLNKWIAGHIRHAGRRALTSWRSAPPLNA